MEKFFNTSGPIKPEHHYNIAPLHRMDWDEISHLIRSERYFVLHAPRQTGKASTLLAIMAELNHEARFACAYANIEGAQTARGDETKGIPAVCSAIARAVDIHLGDAGIKQWLAGEGRGVIAQDQLTALLEHWSRHSDRPVVLLLDEVDAPGGRHPHFAAAPDPGRLQPAARSLSPKRDPLRGARRAGLPDAHRRPGGCHRGQRLQHQGTPSSQLPRNTGSIMPLSAGSCKKNEIS